MAAKKHVASVRCAFCLSRQSDTCNEVQFSRVTVQSFLKRTSVLDKFFSAKYTCNNPETPKKTRGLSPMAPQCTSKGGPHDEPCRRRGNTRGCSRLNQGVTDNDHNKWTNQTEKNRRPHTTRVRHSLLVNASGRLAGLGNQPSLQVI